MTQLPLVCQKCRHAFRTGQDFQPGSSVKFQKFTISCPNCGFQNVIEDSTFRADFNGIIELIKNSDDPLKQAKELREELEKAKNGEKTDNKSKFKKWIPDSPDKLFKYLMILDILIRLLTKEPSININFDVFIKQYNVTNTIELREVKDDKNKNPSNQI